MTPPADLGLTGFGNTCNDQTGRRQLVFEIELNWPGGVPDAPVDITAFTVNFTGGGATVDQPFTPDPIPVDDPGADAVAVASVPGIQGTVTATATIIAVDNDEQVETPVQLSFGPLNVSACGGGGATTSSTTSSTSSTTSTTTGQTTSTTAGATTTTVAGSTTSTSTTLGPNDTTGSLTVSPTTIAQGGSFTVAGTGFAPNVDVTVTLFSDPISLGTLRSNSSGAISGSLSMPASAPAGAHKMEAKGPNAASGNNILSANVQVTARTGSSIARTGDSADLLLPIGIAVVSFGILAFAWRERRLTRA